MCCARIETSLAALTHSTHSTRITGVQPGRALPVGPGDHHHDARGAHAGAGQGHAGAHREAASCVWVFRPEACRSKRGLNARRGSISTRGDIDPTQADAGALARADRGAVAAPDRAARVTGPDAAARVAGPYVPARDAGALALRRPGPARALLPGGAPVAGAVPGRVRRALWRSGVGFLGGRR